MKYWCWIKHTVFLEVFRCVILNIMSTVKSFIATQVVFQLLVFHKYIQFCRKKKNRKNNILNFKNKIRYWGYPYNRVVHKQTLNQFVYELSGCGFESSCSHLSFRFRACFEQGVPWHSGNYKVWIHCETRTRHDKNIQFV